MHLERIRRHGYPELKKERGEHALEKLPHLFVDDFILSNYTEMFDFEIAKRLQEMGYSGATTWNIRYRRRRLGKKKYEYGETKKHRVWVRLQAIKKYGHSCELCGYNKTVDTHHIFPIHKGGKHEIENLMVLCPNCHSLITRRIIELKSRDEIPTARNKILGLLPSYYENILTLIYGTGH